MRLASAFVVLSSLFLVNAAATGTCVPHPGDKHVKVFVSGTWDAEPVAAGSSIVPGFRSDLALSFKPVKDDIFLIQTVDGSLAISGSSGDLKLQKTNAGDEQQHYKITCNHCDIDGNDANNRACRIQPASNTNNCITNHGMKKHVDITACTTEKKSGQFWHFTESGWWNGE
ncbi:hypothetical protein BDV98DRAFT_584220 [Pterulicium gracile]|uniref:Uncharacterized protein n=1 Tax=Pterulicium gracile TaxID=1884261 RepID=A0A5C3QD20_9AGAR|nr:hypothetical protein BDV98DRAFT_584220 [Pterula gracilis]